MTKRDIRKLRRHLQLTQEEFAHLLHVHRITVVRWERGLQSPQGFLKLALEKLKDTN